MKLDGRVITIDQIPAVLAGLSFSSFKPLFPVIHNTSSPDIALYQSWIRRGSPTPEQWLRNLASYYTGLGWSSMPHAFILPDGRIGLGAPFNVRGTHTPSWNGFSIGIEMVGEFERDIFSQTPTEKAAIALVGELCKKFGWSPGDYALGKHGIHFHKEDPGTTHKTCPGHNVLKPYFVTKVQEYMGDEHAHVDVPLPSQTADTGHLTADQLTSIGWLQQQLNAHGASLKVDGVIGPKTKAAVRAWQQAHPPLVVDGIAGPLTRLTLL